MYVCDSSTTSFNYTANTCTGGTLLCSDTAVNPVTTDATCNDTQNSIPIPTAHGSYSVKVYVEDNHSFAASGTASQSYDVEDVIPVLTSYNNSVGITPPAPTAGGSDTVNFTVELSDDNGDGDITLVEGVFFDDIATTNACSSDENECYLDSVCTLSGVDGDEDLVATCQMTVWFNANASDWDVQAQVTDGNGVTDFADAGVALTISPLSALNISESSLAYGTLRIGTLSDEKSSTIENMGNQVIDTLISGDDMISGVNNISRAEQKWSDTTGFSYSAGNTLVETPATTSAATGCFDGSLAVRSVHGSGANSDDILYWLLLVPENTVAGTYAGGNTFATSTCD